MNTYLCEVCHRPGPTPICSRRCQGLRKLKSSLNTAQVRSRILGEVAKLEKGASICPGRLSKMVLNTEGVGLQEERDALSIMREILFAMREEGSLRFFQKHVVDVHVGTITSSFFNPHKVLHRVRRMFVNPLCFH